MEKQNRREVTPEPKNHHSILTDGQTVSKKLSNRLRISKAKVGLLILREGLSRAVKQILSRSKLKLKASRHRRFPSQNWTMAKLPHSLRTGQRLLQIQKGNQVA